MNVLNVHYRDIPAPPSEVGALIDSLSGPTDRLWPHTTWPPMRFDRALQVGAIGGHGPIRYRVQRYQPTHFVSFRFIAPSGFHGHHEFSMAPLPNGQGTRLTHRLEMVTSGSASWSWLLAFRPLHDALLEDALDRASQAFGSSPAASSWSPWVRVLRFAFKARGNRRSAT